MLRLTEKHRTTIVLSVIYTQEGFAEVRDINFLLKTPPHAVLGIFSDKRSIYGKSAGEKLFCEFSWQFKRASCSFYRCA